MLKFFILLSMLLPAVSQGQDKRLVQQGGSIIGSPLPNTLPPTTNYEAGVSQDLKPPPPPLNSSFGKDVLLIHCPIQKWENLKVKFFSALEQYSASFLVYFDFLSWPGEVFDYKSWTLPNRQYYLLQSAESEHSIFFGSGKINKSGQNLECFEIKPEITFREWQNNGVISLSIDSSRQSLCFGVDQCGIKIDLEAKQKYRFFLFPGEYDITPYKLSANGISVPGETVKWNIPAPPIPIQ